MILVRFSTDFFRRRKTVAATAAAVMVTPLLLGLSSGSSDGPANRLPSIPQLPAPLQPAPGSVPGNTDCAKYGLAADNPAAELKSIYADPANPSFDRPAPGVELNKTYTINGVTSQYHLFTRGVDFSKPVGVVVRLHGDGAHEFDEPGGLTACLAGVAAQHNMIYVVGKSPDRSGTVTWWEDIPTNRAWLDGLVHREVKSKVNYDPANVYWMGYSGGAEMLTYGILPRYADWVTRGAMMLGGGGAPGQMYALPSATTLANADLTWVTGMNDIGATAGSFNALEAARAGAEFYRSQGFQRVSELWAAEQDHYSLPHAMLLEQKLSGEAQVHID